MNSEPSPSSAPHGPRDIQQQLDELIRLVRADAAGVHDAGFKALLETTAEVLSGLKVAYRHHAERGGSLPGRGSEVPDDIAAARRRERFHKAHLSPH